MITPPIAGLTTFGSPGAVARQLLRDGGGQARGAHRVHQHARIAGRRRCGARGEQEMPFEQGLAGPEFARTSSSCMMPRTMMPDRPCWSPVPPARKPWNGEPRKWRAPARQAFSQGKAALAGPSENMGLGA
jgi:hypothetical protein